MRQDEIKPRKAATQVELVGELERLAERFWGGHKAEPAPASWAVDVSSLLERVYRDAVEARSCKEVDEIVLLEADRAKKPRRLVSVGPKNVKIKTDKGQTLTFPRSEIIGIANEATRKAAKPSPAAKKPRKKLPPNKRPGWNTSYNAFAETTDDQFAGEIVGLRKAQGYLLRRPTKDCPLWDWYQQHKDDRSAMMFLFGTAKSGTNDGLETLGGLSSREMLLYRAENEGYESVADALLDAYGKYKEWKDNGGVEGAQRAMEEREARMERSDREARFGDDAAFEEYALDDLETREAWDREYAEAVGFVEDDFTGEEMKFSPEALARAEYGRDLIRIDHHDKTFLFIDWD